MKREQKKEEKRREKEKQDATPGARVYIFISNNRYCLHIRKNSAVTRYLAK